MKFLMLGKYSSEAIKNISKERTKKVVELIKKCGGKIDGMYVLVGEYDLAFLLELPSVEDVIKLSVELAKLTGISFTSFPAVDVEKFDKLVG